MEVDKCKEDRILDYISNNHGWHSSERLSKDVFPELVTEELDSLLEKIKSYDQQVARVSLSGVHNAIEANQLTRKFLEKGGFTSIYREEAKECEKESERREIEIKALKSSIEANELNEKNAKFNRKMARINVLFLIINAIFGAISMYTIFRK